MTPPLPLPVRVAAGLVATAVEQARDLPRLALELPVTAVSQALQASMRVQQKVTELAIKGDRVLGVGPPIEDEPAWATFDEDLPPRRNGRESATVTPLHPAPDPLDEPGPLDPGSVSREDETGEPSGTVTSGAGPRSRPPGPEPVPGTSAETDTSQDGPDALPGYAGLTIPQLRGKLRHLGVDDLRALLSWEHAHGDRPPYVTMLSNRIATVSDE
jgi:hypothetical protein